MVCFVGGISHLLQDRNLVKSRFKHLLFLCMRIVRVPEHAQPYQFFSLLTWFLPQIHVLTISHSLCLEAVSAITK